MNKILSILASSMLLAGPHPAFATSSEITQASKLVTPEEILRHIRVLSSDEYEGRLPGTHGADLSVQYITQQFKTLGLAPGNPDGTYVQNVPLEGFKSASQAIFSKDGVSFSPKIPDEMVIASHQVKPEVRVNNSDVVFVGYGVVAPEYGWDDYKGMDVTGKTIVMLINDPAVPDPKDPSKLDDKMFKGKAMTYYGRWTYKYEIASQKKAAACIIIHETEAAGYPYDVVINSFGRESFDIVSPDGNAGLVPVEAWVSSTTAQHLLAMGGQDLAVLKRAAIRPDFKPVALGIKASFDIHNTLWQIKSANVVAKLEGSDPKLRNEYVIYSAHWDHLGREGNKIFSGALDNASGVAAMLSMAKAFKSLKTPPKRSILFIATTAEEQGLLGAKYYAENPLYPLTKTLADINTDVINAWGRTKDIGTVSLGKSTLDEVLITAAKSENRTVIGDAEPEKGHFYRADHFEFAKQGVPALDYSSGVEFLGKDPDFGFKQRQSYTTNDYHKPSDKIKSDWDFSGSVDDMRLLMEVGYQVAQGNTYPQWKAGTEFKALRDKQLNNN